MNSIIMFSLEISIYKYTNKLQIVFVYIISRVRVSAAGQMTDMS